MIGEYRMIDPHAPSPRQLRYLLRAVGRAASGDEPGSGWAGIIRGTLSDSSPAEIVMVRPPSCSNFDLCEPLSTVRFQGLAHADRRVGHGFSRGEHELCYCGRHMQLVHMHVSLNSQHWGNLNQQGVPLPTQVPLPSH